MKPRKKGNVCRGGAKGFTLIEVMVALTIFAVVAVSVQKATSSTLGNHIRLEEKTLATWIAENRMSTLRLTEQLPEEGDEKEELEFGDREWLVETVTEDTNNPFMKKVEIIVHLRGDGISTRQVTSLLGYLGAH